MLKATNLMSTQYPGKQSYYILPSKFTLLLSSWLLYTYYSLFKFLLYPPWWLSVDDIALYLSKDAFWRKVAHLLTSKSTNLPALVSTQTAFSSVKMEGFLSKTIAFIRALDLISLYLLLDFILVIISFLFCNTSSPVSNGDNDRMWKGHAESAAAVLLSPSCIISPFLCLFEAPDSCLCLLSDHHPLLLSQLTCHFHSTESSAQGHQLSIFYQGQSLVLFPHPTHLFVFRMIILFYSSENQIQKVLFQKYFILQACLTPQFPVFLLLHWLLFLSLSPLLVLPFSTTSK